MSDNATEAPPNGKWRQVGIGLRKRPDNRGTDVFAEPVIDGVAHPVPNNILITLKPNGRYFRHPNVNPHLGFPLDSKGRLEQYT